MTAPPQTQPNPLKPCWRGVAIGIDNELSRIVVVPRACGRWDCPRCADFKARRYAALIFEAHPERHVTLTCSPRLHETPEDALHTMKEALRKLAYRLRQPDRNPDGSPRTAARTFEYAAVWDKHISGWPHVHLATWGDFIPQDKISSIWKELTGAYKTDIRAFRDNDEHRHNFVKYLADKTRCPVSSENHCRRVSFSANYHRNAEARPHRGTSDHLDWIWVNINPDVLFSYLMHVCKAREVLSDSCHAVTYELDIMSIAPDGPMLAEAIKSWYWRASDKDALPQELAHACP